ncbi:MAG: hypothetical protein K2M31_09210 [Muribaculaceae bacterium]|nr:hypothetical protein [Muribaculaceae bacterium]
MSQSKHISRSYGIRQEIRRCKRRTLSRGMDITGLVQTASEVCGSVSGAMRPSGLARQCDVMI